MKTKSRAAQLINALDSRIMVLDGAMGTRIQELNLSAEDYGGESLEGCNENLVLTRPDLVRQIHEEYLAAGADIIETNTFGATPLVLDEYELGHRAYEINVAAARIAGEAVAKFTTEERPRFVAGSIGPTTKAISVTGGISFEGLEQTFYEQARGLLDGGVDYLLLETCQDTRNIKAALCAIDRLERERDEKIWIAVSGTIEPMGTMLAGQSVEALFSSLSHRDLLYLGLNCATGPEFMTDHIRSLAELCPFRIACVPNAGLPDENGIYLETPEMVASVLSRFIEKNWLNLVGGCCGTRPSHIKALERMVHGAKPRPLSAAKRSMLSGIDPLEITDEMRPVIVGERTNVIGSKKFKTLICEEKFEEAAEIARAQIKNGAHLIDICLANPDRDELEDMRKFLEKTTKMVRVPLMIDSTDEKVIAMALTYCQGKAIINSVNLEDGEDRFEKVLPLARQFGAALVVGTIDDDPNQGMGISRKRKLEIAERSFELLTGKYGIAPEDIYWDPLVFPCATGDEQYVGSAVETIEGIRLIKQRFPSTRTILGISNVSFGLPAAGREVLNSVFLYHCVQAGLDLAIVNSEKLVRYASIPEDERKLAEDLLWNRGDDPVAAFAAKFRDRKPVAPVNKSTLPLSERLPRYIIEGSKDGLIEDLNEALEAMKPLEIINGPLMAGMDEVGRLFNTNQLIVAEVLQSAEAMKAAVAHLEPHMEKTAASSRGKVILATVKGDVHDIGKNLVEIILANNGFEVVNLGIKIPPEQLIRAVREHQPDIIGLSGLLVKSAQQMVVTADDFSKAGVHTPMLVGGAALTSSYVDRHISKAYASGTVAYAQDAMAGLELAKSIVNPEKFERLKVELEERRSQLKELPARQAPTQNADAKRRCSKIDVLKDLPLPPDFQRHVLKNTPLELIWTFVNPLMLYGRHLGIKGSIVRKLQKLGSDPAIRRELEDLEADQAKAGMKIWQAVEEVKAAYKETPFLRPVGVYQFFKTSAFENSVLILDEKDPTREIGRFEFPRQPKEDGLCLSDYVSGETDTLALFAVSVGRGLRQEVDRLKANGDYLKSHIIQALALESAEAYAELLHAQLRKSWGYPDPPELTMMERFQARYRGKRYSFGYPACPKLDDQATLWQLIRPDEIGIELTDGFMMDPESSVSAIVFHHPQATYFSVGSRGGAGAFAGPFDDDNR